MPEYRHPRAADDEPGSPPAQVHVSRAENATVDDDGTFEAPADVARAVADRHGLALEDIRATGTCQVEKADGEVCGRDLPCPYHSGDGDE